MQSKVFRIVALDLISHLVKFNSLEPKQYGVRKSDISNLLQLVAQIRANGRRV